MSPLSNQRTDHYGGNLVNRMTFPLQVVQRVTRVAQTAGRPFLVGYRLSPEEIEDGGLSLADNLVLLRALAHLPVAYLSLSLHHYDQCSVTLTNAQPVAELVHRFVPTLPLMIAGEITTAADLRTVAGYGTRLAAVGRQIMLDPAWPQKLAQPDTLTTKADWTPATLGVPQSIFQFL